MASAMLWQPAEEALPARSDGVIVYATVLPSSLAIAQAMLDFAGGIHDYAQVCRPCVQLLQLLRLQHGPADLCKGSHCIAGAGTRQVAAPRCAGLCRPALEHCARQRPGSL